MNIDDLALLPKVVANTHFAILVTPKKYGVDELKAQLLGKNTIFLTPKIHDKQKTAIINVDDIAELERIARTKQKTSLRIVLLATETMGEQAQNKFLKLLEEPGDNIHFAFITEDASNLLPTVLSRGQVYQVNKISSAESQAMAKGLAPDISERTLQQIMFLASGLPGEIKKLASDANYLKDQAKLVEAAKTLLTNNEFDTIKTAHSLKDDRVLALKILDLAITIAKESLAKNPGFLQKLSSLEQAHGQIATSSNVRLAIISNLLV